jgi:hypothetical protein
MPSCQGAQHSFDLFYSIRFERLIDGIEAFAAGAFDEPSSHRGDWSRSTNRWIKHSCLPGTAGRQTEEPCEGS